MKCLVILSRLKSFEEFIQSDKLLSSCIVQSGLNPYTGELDVLSYILEIREKKY